MERESVYMLCPIKRVKRCPKEDEWTEDRDRNRGARFANPTTLSTTDVYLYLPQIRITAAAGDRLTSA